MTTKDELLVTVIELEMAILNLAAASFKDAMELRVKIRQEAEIGFKKLSHNQKQQLFKTIFSKRNEVSNF